MAQDQTVLFHSTIFGPIRSRRLGTSLGVNLMPADGKICSFDCLYCEAGFNSQGAGKAGLPSPEHTEHDLREKLRDMRGRGESLDVITFSGNGEPTLHPDFPEIIDMTLRLRDEYYPEAKVSVLTNSTRIFDPQVAEAPEAGGQQYPQTRLCRGGHHAGHRPPERSRFHCGESGGGALGQFKGTGIIQTMLVKGEYDGRRFDNTTPEEIDALIEAYKRIEPKEVMLYSLDRSTPAEKLQKIPHEEIVRIARRMENAGITVAPF